MAIGSQSNQPHRVFVGNIPYGASKEKIIEVCELVGPVVSFKLVTDKETGKPKGYGFCEYRDEETAQSALRNLQGYEMHGRKLKVNVADKGRKCQQAPAVSDSVSVGSSTLDLKGSQSDQQSSSLGNINDPLVSYFTTMSRSQLSEFVSEFKTMSLQDHEQTRQLLLSAPNLPNALLQAEIMLGINPPQMLQQMPYTNNIQQDYSVYNGQTMSYDGQTMSQTSTTVEDGDGVARASKKAKLNNGEATPSSQFVDIATTMQPVPIMQQMPCINIQQDYSGYNGQTMSQTSTTVQHGDGITRASKKAKLNSGEATPSCQFVDIATTMQPEPIIEPVPMISEKHVIQMQLHADDVESELLQQVMNLTQEQISSLTPEEQQQVIQLQQIMLQIAS